MMDSGDESDDEPMSTKMLEDISDISKYPLSVIRRETLYRIRGFIKQRQTERKGALVSTKKMGKGLHKVFKVVINNMSQVLPILGESGAEVSYFIPDARNFSEVTRSSDDTKKPWLKATKKDIKNLINNHNVLVQDLEKCDPVTPCMNV